jgi:hypothetical protein
MESESFASPFVPDEVMRYCGQSITSAGYVVSYGPGVLSGVRQDKPSGCLLVVLLVLGIIPGIIYLIVSGKTRTISVMAAPYGEGSWVTINGDPTSMQTLKAGIGGPAAQAERAAVKHRSQDTALTAIAVIAALAGATSVAFGLLADLGWGAYIFAAVCWGAFAVCMFAIQKAQARSVEAQPAALEE